MDKAQTLAASIVSVSLLLLAGCDYPLAEGTQVGYRGTGMVDVQSPGDSGAEAGYPDPLPAIDDAGPKARDIYQNVQVLGDLSVARFTRLMAAMTAWVSPEQGCNYCHNPANLASDDIYTKVVSRRMLQMTRTINGDWGDHVGQAGVNCYTCHRGKNVPEYIWFTSDYEAAGMTAYGGNRVGQNRPAASVAYASLPSEPFTGYLTSPDNASVRVASTTPYPPADGGASFRKTEATYGLMMSWSSSLGVNCTYCHMTAAFQNWQQSTPARVKAYHGMNMVRALNDDYLIPLQPAYPPNRLGPTGDAPKAYCATCHQGNAKPLGGADAVSAYQALGGGD